MMISAMAALKQGAELTRWSYTPPPPGPFDCHIKVLACGLCHSDVHMMDNDWAMSRFPMVPGHEIVGLVQSVGEAVTHLKPGDRVGVGWQRASCLQCPACLRGDENLCPDMRHLIADSYGGFADHVMLDSRFCFLLPHGLKTESAGPLLCGGITVYSALHYAGMTSGQEIGVIGLGGLGHLAVQFAAKLGNRVTAFTRTPDKEADAVKFGATSVILLKDGRPSRAPDRPLDILINTVWRHLDWNAFLDHMGSDSTLTFVGIPLDPLSIGLDRLLMKRRRIMASNIAGRPLIQQTLDVADRFGIAPQIETFPMAEANQAIRRLRENQMRYRAVLANE